MSRYVDNIEFVTEECCSCGIAFAMPLDFKQRRLKDRKVFYCPAGHQQHYTGQSEEQKLRAELERKQQILEAEQARANELKHEKDEVTRAHQRMRTRIQNGVCPCCNRTFQNLLQHMKTEHAEQPTVKSLREAYGLSQSALAREIGVYQTQVSSFERDKPVASYAQKAITTWMESQTKK